MIRLTLLLAAAFLVQPASRLQGIVGLWKADAESGLVADGAVWRGREDAATVTPLARDLFGEPGATLLANLTSATAYPLAVDRATTRFSQGTLRVRFKLVAGATDQSAGIVFGLQPNGEYRYLRYNTKDGNLALWGYANGDRIALLKGDATKQLPLGAWHELVVRIEGQRVHGAVTGHPTLDVTFPLATPVDGRVGVWAKRDVVTAFRDFVAQPAR